MRKALESAACACAAFALVLLLPVAVRGQAAHEADRVEIRARLDSLSQELAKMQSLDSAWQDSVDHIPAEVKVIALDSVDVGPFHIVGAEEAVRMSEKYARSTWLDMAPLFRNLDLRPASILLVLDHWGVRSTLAKRIGPGVGVVSLGGSDRELWGYSFERTMGQVLSRYLPQSVRGWLNGEGIASTHVPNWTYRALALPIPDSTHPTSGPSPCVMGDMASCRRLLGLSGSPTPYGDAILRASFITWIVKRSAPGAVAASTNDASAVVPALERLGGAPLDTLIAGWRADLIAGRPREMAGGFALPLSVVVWVLIFAAISSRSTRWRLG